ncbi:MAG: DUF4150 domain-containing protein [Polyangiaceae bacterium]|nr:DUF4150 domain-containing protein [Polyangiaceae bacterium]
MSGVTVSINGLSLVHQNSGGISTATLPDVCITPPAMTPAPYPNVALSRDLEGGSSRVRADGGRRIAVAGSRFARSSGGEAGTGGGVTSGTSGGPASWLSHSLDVRIEGRGACRLTDKMLHNGGNTIDCAGIVQAQLGRGIAVAGSSRQKKKTPRIGIDKGQALTRISRFGIDTNDSTLDTNFAKAQGCTFVGRYLSFDGEHPPLSREEADRLRGAGLDLFAIWELTKYRAVELESIEDERKAGVDDATQARNVMKLCGGEKKPIYFTVDFPVTPEHWRSWIVDKKTGKHVQRKSLILAYFEGILDVLPVERVGAYGPYIVIKKLFDQNMITYGWQWTFTEDIVRIDHRAQLQQYDIYPGQEGWGVSGAGALDYDRAVWPDFGQW